MSQFELIKSLAIITVATTLAGCTQYSDERRTVGPITNYAAGNKDSLYQPWSIDEYELFGLTSNQIRSKWQLTSSPDGEHFFAKPPGSDSGQTFNLKFDADGKVSAAQRVFKGCTSNYEGPWLYSQREALEFSIGGLNNFNENELQLKRHRAQQILAKLTRERS